MTGSNYVTRSIIILSLLLAGSTISAQQVPQVPAPQFVGPAAAPGEIVVGFDTTLPQVSPQAAMVLAEATTIRSFPQIGAKVIRVPQAEVGPMCASLANIEGIRYAEPNYRRRVLLAAPNDPAYSNLDTMYAYWDEGDPTYYQWNLHVINALEAWNVWPNTYYTAATKPANPVKLAVIDTGIDIGGTDGIPHPDFINAGGSSPDAAFGGQIDMADARNVRNDYAPTDIADDYGHGTAVAGVAGAATNNGSTGPGQGGGIAGLAYNCQIMPIKAFDSTGQGTEADLVAGILWAVDHGAVVINISAGDYYYSQAEQDAVDYAWAHGTLIVAAAGNDGTQTFIYPAACTGVMSVAATMWEPLDTPCTYSNYGEYVLVSAPAGDVSYVPLGFWFTWTSMPTEPVDLHYAGYPGDVAMYEYQAGTSLSCPFVAGLAALYAGYHGITQSTPNGVWQMWEAILKGCDNPSGGSGWDPHWGWGRINAYQTMLGNNNRGATVGRVTGQVKYYGTPVDNAIVEAVPVGGGSPVSATTRDDGMYRLSNIPPGLYNITGTYFGQSTTLYNVEVQAGVDLPRQYIAIPANPPPTVTSITPNSGANDGTVSITNLAGANFVSGATVKLAKAGETDIDGTSVTVVSSTQITCTFDLTGAAPGTWDVTVTNPDGQSGTLTNGFTVTGDAIPPELTEAEIAATHGGGVGEVAVTIADGYVEPRNSGITHLRLHFSEALNPATVDSSVVTIVGVLNGDCSSQVASVTLEGADDILAVELTSALPDQDTYTVTVSTAVQDVSGNPVSMGTDVVLSALQGDANGDRQVDVGDMLKVRSDQGEAVTEATAGCDINMDGQIDVGDMLAVRSNSGHTAPAPEDGDGGGTSSLGVAWCTLAVSPTSNGGAEIIFTLGSDAVVEVTVLNIAGRPIRRLTTGQPSPSGLNRLYWDGRSSSSTKVPAGRYLVKLTARHEEGQQTCRICPVIIAR